VNINTLINDILHPEKWLHGLGPIALVIAALMVIAETGILVGFFLPGDSLLFTVGLLAAPATAGAVAVIDLPIWLVCLVIALSAVAGDQLGYWLGRRLGPAIFKRDDSRFFKHENVDKAHNFFERHGSKAVVFAHYVPIMRTFVPVAAGVGQMKYGKYVRYNLIGAFSWGIALTLLGYFLGSVAFVRDHVIVVTLSMIALSLVPVLIEVIKARSAKKAN